MFEVKFSVQWSETLKVWRVSGSDGTYWDAKTIDDIPKSVRGMLRCEGNNLINVAKE